MTPNGVIVICVGNPDRGDDGVALAVLDALRATPVDGVDVAAARADPATLMALWEGRRAAILVDAVRSGGAAGRIHRIDCSARDGDVPLVGAQPASSHALGLGTALRLGRELGILPERVVLVGVEVGDMSIGGRLSLQVDAAVGAVAESALRAARECVEGRV